MEYRIEFEVRDNEIDIQGVVNNANYFICSFYLVEEELPVNLG